MGREKRLRGSSWFCALLAAGAAAGCGSGQARFPCTDPLDCPGGPSSSNLCQKDSDCGDGICGSDGKCRDRYSPGTQQTACARVTCQPGYFCANGSCLLATAQCKPPDPACIYVPRGAFEPPAHQWWWPWKTPDGPFDTTGNASYRTDLEYPDFVQVMSTPAVMRLHAKDASPAVVFNSFANNANSAYVESQGVMRAVRGVDGSPLWTAPADFVNHQELSVDGNASIAAGDCLGTGEVCFITGGWRLNDVNPTRPSLSHQHGGLVAYGSDGRLLWSNPDMQVWWGGPAIARIIPPAVKGQPMRPAVVVGKGVVDGATGKTLCDQAPTDPLDGDQVGGNGDGTLTAIADINLDGIPEIVTANQAYQLVADPTSSTGYSCKRLFQEPVHVANGICPGGNGKYCGAGFVAIADFGGYGASKGYIEDGHPQIVVVSRGYLRIHDWTGGMLLNPIPLPGDPNCLDPNGLPIQNQGGAPTVADFDGDGLPEVGIAGQGGYIVWKPGVGYLWRSPTRDCSGNTGSSVFDFEGKGQANVVYGDECYTRIYDGRTGTILVQEPNSSCTAYEMPIVADIDGTGRARIVVPANNTCFFDCPWAKAGTSKTVGLKALKSPSDKWVNTRSVWNQHTYHVTNVNLDGTLPFPETNSWAPGQSNSYRQNVQGQGVFSAPDLIACELAVDMTQCVAGKATVTATVYNGGALVVRAGVGVTIYADAPSGSYLVGKGATTRQLQPGDSEKVAVPWSNPPLQQSVSLRGVLDEALQFGVCHPENRTTTIGPVKCTPLG